MTDFSNSLTNKEEDVRTSNILAARGILDLIRTSLGPRGLDKMLETPKNDVLITNDGATIMKELEARHPTARMLVELSESQDVEAGDGTTSVVVLCCSLLVRALDLMKIGVHPSMISSGYSDALKYCYEKLPDVADSVQVEDDEILSKIAKTTLYSKVISNCSDKLAPLCVRAVKQIYQQGFKNVDLSDIKIVKKLGGTVEDTALVQGICTGKKPGNEIDYEKSPRVMAISFSLAPPKTDMDSQIVVSDDAAINRLLEEERKITLKMCKAVAKAGCTCLLVQKSILRTAISDMAMYYLEKLKIAVIPDIDREDFEFYCKSLELEAATNIDEVGPQKVKEFLEFSVKDGVTYILNETELKTCTILVRGANKLIIEEAERSIHDALCSVRSIIKMPYLVPGGACVEGYLSHKLMKRSSEVAGTTELCYRAFADALDVIPLTLAENGGLNPIKALTDLKESHSDGKLKSGLDILNGGAIRDMHEIDVLSPMLTSHSALGLAVETCRMILKIDDIVIGR